MLVDKVKMLQKNVLLKFYKHIKYHYYYYDYDDYNSLYRFQISSAILRLFSFEIADQNLQ